MPAFNPIWITLGPIIVINSILITSFFAYHLWIHKAREHDFEGAKRGGSKLVGSVTRDWWFWTTNPVVKLFVKLHMGPNVLTSTGFLFSVVAAFLFAFGFFGYAGWMMIFGASFDFFDGRVARITGKTSRSGAFFDAVMDRFGEGACMLGLACYFRDSFMLIVVIIALIGSLLVSYTKARAEGMGVECNVGTMQRPERIVCIGVAAILDPIVNLLLARFFASPPPILLMLALILVAAMTFGTAFYRMIYVMNALDTADNREKESLPQIITQLSTHEGREKFWDENKKRFIRAHSEKDE